MPKNRFYYSYLSDGLKLVVCFFRIVLETGAGIEGITVGMCAFTMKSAIFNVARRGVAPDARCSA